ncbi:MAG: ribosome biogenesis GTP-binding protein YihA/YsxC [[Lactobacillus] timonensis]|jgi:GTP-binding protein|uniref:ribosome biogenesis GTP-binding protein YihA/YsxC n=1 Tax=[Lactobacillus] timonensis TaxID=1970790 RepID=UPI000C843F9B|nr:ribosome biogenesis GTP-binding protein YihA/YsxC [[Lactobacillus] timonensis]MCI1925945.1 ribosome biogenesis GTP-binding protein YihA/YsxC [[Lactobacillus] timonensis]MCI1957337.1 ribosome biogenesis GTP-binding protein YihA/YsxC [[Lactobacillus] timonensis]MCI1970386.1 ribosome biogenesis GTP-binding protein YihA/YsxC [[Lactobacillus] timonensis]MCI2006531.1 ribosome biogenesis GTP-binding protein YihA/YsxC [[Lactobacillus] timonensis]
MQVNHVELTISAVEAAQYPQGNDPEIALVGRSNVGKSSLTNVLINRRNFAHTSSQPGKTQTLNFYHVNNRLFFVDVPGYGFAKVSKKERERFGQMIEQYLTSREQLRGVIMLVDARHQPTEDDVMMYQYLHYYQLPTLVVATKIDKVKASQRTKMKRAIIKKLQLQDGDSLLTFSAVKQQGSEQAWQWISKQTGIQ